jgi:pimeloyl-ACP methyl ester carboxylesterase
MCEPIIDRLDPARYRCLAIDLRAHGASVTPDDVGYTDTDMVADLTAVAERYGLQGAWAVGHSMGGATSLLTEAYRPGTFERLWVFEPIIFPREGTTEGQSQFVEATRRRRPGFASRAEALARYRSRPPLDELHPAVLAAYVQHGFVDVPDGTVRLACRPDNEARLFEQFLRLGHQRLAEIDALVTVAYGTATAEQSGTWAPRIADALPNGTAEPFEGDHHFGCFADLDRVVASLNAFFLDGPDRSGR